MDSKLNGLLNITWMMNPLPIPEQWNELSNLRLILGVSLVLAGALVFQLWRERLLATKQEERAQYLMFNLIGGSWIFAVFAFCSGLYFIADYF
jgi:hypothetical protein